MALLQLEIFSFYPPPRVKKAEIWTFVVIRNFTT